MSLCAVKIDPDWVITSTVPAKAGATDGVTSLRDESVADTRRRPAGSSPLPEADSDLGVSHPARRDG